LGSMHYGKRFPDFHCCSFYKRRKDKQGGEKDYKERAYDLAQLPFSNDQATDALLQSDKYADVAKKDLISTLFSAKDKEKRQQEDKVKGVPAAPDEEYKEAEIQKENAEKRSADVKKRASQPATTSLGALRAGSMVSASSGGAMSNIWQSKDEEKEYGKGGSASGSQQLNKEQLLAGIKAGRSTGFVDATLLSNRAANSKDLEAASANAINAFQKGAQNNKDALSTDLEKDASGLVLNSGDMPKLSKNALDNADKAADKAKERQQQNSSAGACKSIVSSWSCFSNFILEKGVTMIAQAGTSALTNKWGGTVAKAGGK